METTNTLTINKLDKYVIPTQESPIFTAYCDCFGRIETGMYKDWYIQSLSTVGSTFAVSFANAVNLLHEWIEDNREVIENYPKCNFYIEVIDGTIKKDDYVSKKVYEISASKSRKYLL